MVTPPTCTTEGYTTHKCDCGDVKVDSKVPVTDHYYYAEVIEYPTLSENGSKKMICQGCGKHHTEEIEALTASMPTLSEILLALFGEIDYTIKAENGSSIIIIDEVDQESVYFQEQTYFAINVAEVNLDTKGEMAAGHIKLDFGIAISSTEDRDSVLVEDFNQVVSLYIYVENDIISIEMVDVEGETIKQDANATVLFYTVLGEMFGIPEMPLAGVVNLVYGISQLGPVIEKIQGDLEASEEYQEYMLESLEALATELFTAVVEENGNTEYELNLTALSDFFATISKKTLAEHLDLAYGEGTMASIVGFIKDLPLMTVRELADAAIEMAAAYDLTVEEIYQYIDNVIFYISGQPISIETIINMNAKLTVADILIGDTSDMSKEEKDEIILSIEGVFADLADSISELTFDQIFNLLLFGDINYSPNHDGVVFSITESIEEGMIALSDIIYANFVVTPEGEVVYADVNCGFHFAYEKTDSSISADLVIEESDYLDLNVSIVDGVVAEYDLVLRDNLSVDHEVYIYDEDGYYAGSFIETYYVFGTLLHINYNRANVNGKDKATLVVESGYAEMNADQTGAVEVLDTAIDAVATITKADDKETINLDAYINDFNELVGTIVLNEGNVVDCDLVLNLYSTTVDPETMEETTKCSEIASIKYSNDLNGNITLDYVIDTAHIEFKSTTVVDEETGAEHQSLSASLYRIEEYGKDEYLSLALVAEDGLVEQFALSISDYTDEGMSEIINITYATTENGAEVYLAVLDNVVDITRETLEDGGYRITVDYDIEKASIGTDEVEIFAGTETTLVDNFDVTMYSFYYFENVNGVYQTVYGDNVYFLLDAPLSYLYDYTLEEYLYFYGYDLEAYETFKSYADEEGKILVTDETIDLLYAMTYDSYFIYYVYVGYEVAVYETEYHYYYFSGEGTVVIESK